MRSLHLACWPPRPWRPCSLSGAALCIPEPGVRRGTLNLKDPGSQAAGHCAFVTRELPIFRDPPGGRILLPSVHCITEACLPEALTFPWSSHPNQLAFVVGQLTLTAGV